MHFTKIRQASRRVYHSARFRQVLSKSRQLAGRRQHAHPMSGSATPLGDPSDPMFPPPQVARVDDPCGEMSLVAIRGDVRHGTIEQLQDVLTDLPCGRFVHLDLGGATIRTSWAMRLLEAIADDLERRGIVLRVVGLDPQHPMLAPTL